MGGIGHAVDHRHGGVARQLLQLPLVEGPDHDPVAVPAQSPGGILDRLSPARLGIRSGEVDGMAPQLEHSGLKGGPGPGGVLGEHHGQHLALQLPVGNAVLHVVFQLIRQIQDRKDLLPAQLRQLQQIFFHRAASITWRITATP